MRGGRWRRAAAALLLAVTLLASSAPAGAAIAAAPSRATVLEVQDLFAQLGYPLADLHRGKLGVSTRGALSYFQRKYHLPQTGYPDQRTIAAMRGVARSLRGGAAAVPGTALQPPSTHIAQPHDLVERIAPGDPPFLAIAVALVAVLALLTLGSRRSRVRTPRPTRGRRRAR